MWTARGWPWRSPTMAPASTARNPGADWPTSAPEPRGAVAHSPSTIKPKGGSDCDGRSRSRCDRRPTRVFVLDDHELVRRGLVDLMDGDPGPGGGGRGCDGRGGPAPDPGGATRHRTAGRAAARRQRDQRLPPHPLEPCREVRCLILTSYDDDEALYAAVMAGASGYLLKEIGRVDAARGHPPGGARAGRCWTRR